MITATTTVQDYRRAFTTECANLYPQIDALERSYGYSVARARPGALEAAARTLACPVKRHAPNWQHGRILYAATCRRIALNQDPPYLLVDIGTAKGFSALCFAWALWDQHVAGRVVTLDVIHPDARVSRNSVAELEAGRLLTIREYLADWPEARAAVQPIGGPSHSWLAQNRGRIAVAFVDGKHTFAAVAEDLDLIKSRQDTGDVLIADDVQIAGVAQAVAGLRDYDVHIVEAHAERRYAIATKQ